MPVDDFSSTLNYFRVVQSIIPAALVPAAQSYLQSQGLNPYIFQNDGSVNPTALVQMAFNDLELRTNISPPIHFPISANGAPPDPVMEDLLQRTQPTVTLSGPAGSVTLAPYGNAVGGGDSWLPLVAVGVGGLAVLGWLLFAD